MVRTFKEFVFTHSDSVGQGFPHKERLLQPPYDSAMKDYYADLSQAVSSNSRHQAVYVRVLPTSMEEIHAIEEDEPRDPFSVGRNTVVQAPSRVAVDRFRLQSCSSLRVLIG